MQNAYQSRSENVAGAIFLVKQSKSKLIFQLEVSNHPVNREQGKIENENKKQ